MQIAILTVICVIVLSSSLSVCSKVQDELDARISNRNNVKLQGGLDAIAEIHKVLDDDQNGAVDSLESEDFIREDLSIKDDEQEDQRQLSLHHGDNSISVLDMQKNWLSSEVHNWTTADVELWLKDVVGLPQYLPIFKKYKIDGNVLPRLALNTDHLIQSQLGITDQNHKNKLILKAMDLVLFGPPTVFYNPLKDALLALAILVAISGLFFSTVQRKKAQDQIDKMLKEVDKLNINEQKFLEIQDVLQEAEQKNESVIKEKHSLERKLKTEINLAKNEAERLCKEREGTKAEVERLTLAEQELAQVRSALYNAESKRFENITLYRELQCHLRTTYRKEREQYNVKKAAADRQLEEAKQWGLKMKKKKAGMMSSLKMIHGNSLEVVENRICSAKSALIEATQDMQELYARWRRIESICNFNITSLTDDTNDFGSTVSLAGSDSTSSPEPSMTRSNSSPTKSSSSPTPTCTSRHIKLTGSLRTKKSPFHGSSPNLVAHESLVLPNCVPRNLSSTALKDLAKKSNGFRDSTDSDDSLKTERRKGKKLWRLVRESRLNADPKWQELLGATESEPI